MDILDELSDWINNEERDEAQDYYEEQHREREEELRRYNGEED